MNKKYEKLNINFPISKELENAIDLFMESINKKGGSAEDCYRSEIDFWIKDCKYYKHKLTDEQYNLLRNYYVLGGIYKDLGYPWENN